MKQRLGMAPPEWIAAIGARPLGERVFAAKTRARPPLGTASRVEFIQFPFRPWDGPIGEWREDFGKGRGQVYSLDGREPRRSCNEVEVAKRLRTVRDDAFWFSEYNPTSVPAIWQPWVRTLRGQTPRWLALFDASVRQHLSSPRGGMPDVVAWSEEDPVGSAIFVECKGPREAVSEAQEDWLWAARHAGVGLSQIAVSLRPF